MCVCACVRACHQAQALAARLSSEGVVFDAVFSSDLVRTRQTAEEILRLLPPGTNVHYDARLREKGAGSIEGKPLGTAEKMARQNKVAMRDFRPPGGECWRDVAARSQSFIRDLVSSCAHGMLSSTRSPCTHQLSGWVARGCRRGGHGGGGRGGGAGPSRAPCFNLKKIAGGRGGGSTLALARSTSSPGAGDAGQDERADRGRGRGRCQGLLSDVLHDRVPMAPLATRARGAGRGATADQGGEKEVEAVDGEMGGVRAGAGAGAGAGGGGRGGEYRVLVVSHGG